MNQGVETILYPVKDLTQAKKLFTRLLEAQPHVDQPFYVGYNIGNQEIGLVLNRYKNYATLPAGSWSQCSKIQTATPLG